MKTWDVFISYASEDKEEIVEPIIKALKQQNITYWYDKEGIKWGDSIVKEVNKGLNESKYGLFILSERFINKGWTTAELNSLLNEEFSNGQKKVLPLIVGDEQEILKSLPFLKGKKYLIWDRHCKEIINNLNLILSESLIKTKKQIRENNGYKDNNEVNYTSMSILIDPFIDILNIENDLPDKIIKGDISLIAIP